MRRTDSSTRSPRSRASATGPSPTASVTWLEPPVAASRPSRSSASATAPAAAAAASRTVEPAPAQAQDEHEVGGAEHDEPAAVGAEAVPADRHERERGDRDPGTPEQGGADERRDEQHRLEQVVDAVEAARLGWAERRQRHRLGIDSHRHEVGGQDRGAGETEREEHGRDARGERDHGVEPEVRGQHDEQGAEGQSRPDKREHDQQDCDRDRQRQAQAVVAVDAVVERLERGCRIVALDDAQAAGRDVGDRDEAVDPRRVRREQAALAEQRDRVATVVLAPPGRRQRRRGSSARARRGGSAACPSRRLRAGRARACRGGARTAPLRASRSVPHRGRGARRLPGRHTSAGSKGGTTRTPASAAAVVARVRPRAIVARRPDTRGSSQVGAAAGASTVDELRRVA